MGKHTPGPWHVGPYYKSDVESRFGRVAECGVTRGDQAMADARLIAAAPDMLAALKDIFDYWNTTGFSECDEGCDCIVDQARAAIAKAEGLLASAERAGS